MTILLTSLDEPLGIPAEKWNAYALRRDEWMQQVLVMPGLKELRAYMDPNRETPTSLIIYEFEDRTSAQRFIQSDVVRQILLEMRGMGVTSIAYRIWENSPVFPEAVQPPNG